MAHERSTDYTHSSNPDQKRYDWLYYEALFPFIRGNVLDIGSGVLQFVREYSKYDKVESVVCLDKFTEEAHNVPKTIRVEWICPEKIEGNYDTIVSTEFIEHIKREQLEPLLENITECLNTNGRFVGSTPNKKYPTTNPYHLYEYTLPELEEILKKYFSYVDIKDIGMDCQIWIAEK